MSPGTDPREERQVDEAALLFSHVSKLSAASSRQQPILLAMPTTLKSLCHTLLAL